MRDLSVERGRRAEIRDAACGAPARRQHREARRQAFEAGEKHVAGAAHTREVRCELRGRGGANGFASLRHRALHIDQQATFAAWRRAQRAQINAVLDPNLMRAAERIRERSARNEIHVISEGAGALAPEQPVFSGRQQPFESLARSAATFDFLRRPDFEGEDIRRGPHLAAAGERVHGVRAMNGFRALL